MRISLLLAPALVCCLALPAPGQEAPADPVAAALGADRETLTHRPEVIYGRKAGMALTLDVFTPKKANGAAVILVVSGGWFSSHDFIDNFFKGFGVGQFPERGYTLFAVVHGSQPQFTIPEILEDVHRATLQPAGRAAVLSGLRTAR